VTLVTAVVVSVGCTKQTVRTPLIPGTNTPLDNPADVISKEGVVRSSERSVQVVVIPLGLVPWDGATLPLVSPDGRTVATQTGIAASLPAVLASEGAEPPEASFVELFAITPQSANQAAAAPVSLGRIRDRVLLGRSVDRTGFLVEAPQDNGARWIGKASWSTGEVHWLVQGDDVNAHASLGDDGRLAFSRLDPESGSFNLVVREPNGDEWIFGAAGEDWMMPTWSGRDDGLFALRLIDGELRLTFGMAISRGAYRQSYREYPLVHDGMTRLTAFKMLENSVNIADAGHGDTSTLTFVHPTERAMAMWRPLAAEHERILLNPQSFAAVPIDRRYALVSLKNKLVRRHVSDVQDEVAVTRSLNLIRPVFKPDWPLMDQDPNRPGMARFSTPFMMLTPQPDGVGLTALYLLEG
jgi:hypothetical protein